MRRIDSATISLMSINAPSSDAPPPTARAALQAGRDKRKQLSRARLAELSKRKSDFDPVSELLKAAKGRLTKLLPLKYSRMSVSPFAFFRGSVSLMAADMAREPHTALTVQLCGDAHVQNLGCFEGPDGRLIFDINDFDETIPGPWEWDVKRMATSIVLAGSEAGHPPPSCAHALEAFASNYCASIEMLAEQPILTAARHQIHRVRGAEAISAAFVEAERATPCDLLKKYTEPGKKNQPRFKNIGHVIWRVGGGRGKEILGSLETYRQSLPPERLHLFNLFRPLDVGFKVVGTGSVGLRDYIVLMEGNGAGDPMFLQIKQEVRSAYAAYLKLPPYANQGQRVAEGQRRIQPLSDLLLGWTRIGDQDYLVRQLNDHKGGIDLEHLKGDGLAGLATIAGELLARGHARSGDALAIKGYIGAPEKVVKALVHYGREYASRAEEDYQVFRKAIQKGRIRVFE